METILIISYYFPPVNHIAAQRAEAFQKYFPNCGLRPIIGTRHWTVDDNSWKSYFKGNDSHPRVTKSESGGVLRLPFREAKGYEKARRLGRTFHQIYILANAVVGNTQSELEIYKDFLPPLREYLRENPVDYLLATFQPASAVKLALQLSREFDIPYIVDFRDIWSQAAFDLPGTRMNLRRKLLSRVKEFYLKKWVKDAALVSGVNEAIIDRIRKLCPEVPATVVVTNGFEPELFEEICATEFSTFTISVVGTVYPETDLSIFFEGILEFLKNKSEAQVLINFVGAGAVPESAAKLRDNLPEQFLRITDRVSHEEAISALKGTHVLFDVGWKGFKGITPGKIFDYLGARKNILIAPSDHDTMEKIVNETGAGKTADTVEEFVEILEGWYQEWKQTGSIKYYGDEEKINFYTRGNQTAILAREILKIGTESSG